MLMVTMVNSMAMAIPNRRVFCLNRGNQQILIDNVSLFICICMYDGQYLFSSL